MAIAYVEPTATVATCTAPVKDRGSPNSSTDGEGALRASFLMEEL